jgi:hypothetical protein
MHAYPVRPRIGECGDKFIGILDHQVAVERQLGRLAERSNDWRSDSQIRNEMSIHDVDVDDTAPALGRGANLLAQPGKISRKN